jgi:dTDP-4-amino-4,6-dideoxygalactose transaminase
MKIKPRNKFLPIATAVFGKEEKKEVIDTLESGWLTLGPKTKKFEEALSAYTGAKYAVALNSGSAALHLSLLALGLKEGDEVITTPFTFASTVHAILHCGAKPVFVDIEPKMFNIDVNQIEEAITKKTKALLPVHYAGHSVEMDKLRQLARKYKLYIVEDAAHAIGAKYKGEMVGTIGDITCFSFHPVKNLTTGDGGAVTTNDKKLAEKIMVMRVNGMDKESWKRNTSTGSWDYAIVSSGLKYHMNDVAASLGIHQLKKLDGFIKIRERVALAYDKELRKIDEVATPHRSSEIRHAHNLYPILVDTSRLKIDRNQIMERLKEYNIGSIVYYRPLHLQPYFSQILGYKWGDFLIAEYVFEKLICLPLYHGMRPSDAVFVSKVLEKIIVDGRR